MNKTMNNTFIDDTFIDDTFYNTEEEIVLDPPTELFEEANTIAQNNENDEKFEFILKYDINQKDFLLSLLEALGINPSEIHENEDMTISINLNMSQLAFIKKMDFIEEVHSTIISNPYIFLEAEAASASDSTTVEIDHINEEILITSPVSIENLNIETVPLITPTIDTTLTEDEVANNEVATMSVNNSRCSSCISNSTMETAKQINTERFISGCICCPETEEWFKFTAPETTTYTIYTMGTLDTIGAIYDASGTKITCNDDYVYGGNLNFRIICDLTADETYYVRVRLDKKATGKYTIRVTKKILAKSVIIKHSPITLFKGVTYELPIRPDYVYKRYNGAERIPDFSVSIYPADTTEQLIYWYKEPFNNTVTCTTGIDDNGERYYHITAMDKGTTKLYAKDWNENGKKDECTITVTTPYEYQLKKLGGFSDEVIELILKLYDKVDTIFASENTLQKAWRCARLLSEFSYDTLKFGINYWNHIAGSVTTCKNELFEIDRRIYFINTLGFTEDEYEILEKALNTNHVNEELIKTLNPDNEEKVSNFIDFTHMQYALAARLAYTLGLNSDLSNWGPILYTGNFKHYSNEEVSYLGGWFGDAILADISGTGTPSMDNRDYMSDLDAENIYHIILQGNSAVEASNMYYANINNSNTRADVFLQHIPYNTVEEKIFNELLDDQNNAYETIKSNYPDTYKFLKSLNYHLHVYAEE